MGEYLHPDVIIEEVSAGIKPIEGVSTTTGAFLGIAEKGPIAEPELITNWTQFIQTYGGYLADSYLAYNVFGFFNNGGRRLYVVRVAHFTDITDPETCTAITSTDTLVDRAATPLDTLKIDALNEGTWGDKISISIEDAKRDPINKFRLIVKDDNVIMEVYEELIMTDIEEKINGVSAYIIVENLDSATTPPENRPAVQADISLAGGDDGLTGLVATDYIGDANARNGIYAFDPIDEINNLIIPGETDVAIANAALAYCSNRMDCFYVADAPFGLKPLEVQEYRNVTGNFNNSYGALCYPWILVNDPIGTGTNPLRYVPRAGHEAGLYARTDINRGVHKAPAGLEAVVNGALGLAYSVTNGEQDILNPDGINCARAFPGQGIVEWGTRTLSADPEWRYVPVRRLLMFIEESIQEGIRWSVFEPNDATLWAKLRLNITAFLLTVWREGALQGEKWQEAFYVKCDSETNPQSSIDQGKVFVEIGVAPVKPAEFVIVRIGQWDGGRLLQEMV